MVHISLDLFQYVCFKLYPSKQKTLLVIVCARQLNAGKTDTIQYTKNVQHLYATACVVFVSM